MRITAFRAWVGGALTHGAGLARRAGLAVSRRLRSDSARVDEASGVGDDDLARGRGSRVWLEALGEQLERLFQRFEQSRFERQAGRIEGWLRRALGLPVRRARAVEPPRPRPARVAPPAPPPDPELTRALAEQVRQARVRAHTQAVSEAELARRARGERDG